jgi:uncharacterized phage infection (PIP) family protein YhgE
MKDSLKDFIGKHRETFDDKAPAEESGWKAIEATLPQMKVRSLWNSLVLWRVAAVLFLGLSVYFFVSSKEASMRKQEIAFQQGDLSDLESFYHSQIAEKISLINDFDSAEAEQFTQDFQKLDAMYQVLSDEMKNHPSQKVKDALVLNLLVRIDLLNQQLKKLEDNKKKRHSTETV